MFQKSYDNAFPMLSVVADVISSNNFMIRNASMIELMLIKSISGLNCQPICSLIQIGLDRYVSSVNNVGVVAFGGGDLS
jgi:hypothetical protein